MGEIGVIAAIEHPDAAAAGTAVAAETCRDGPHRNRGRSRTADRSPWGSTVGSCATAERGLTDHHGWIALHAWSVPEMRAVSAIVGSSGAWRRRVQ